MENVFLVTAVVGVVEFLRRVQQRDWYAALTIVAAAVVGALAGYFGAPGVEDMWVGVVGGLSASGLVTAATKFGKGA